MYMPFLFIEQVKLSVFLINLCAMKPCGGMDTYFVFLTSD